MGNFIYPLTGKMHNVIPERDWSDKTLNKRVNSVPISNANV